MQEKMATRQDLGKDHGTITKPLIGPKNEAQIQSDNGGLWMVLLSTSVAVCGSFEFGSCVSIKISSNGMFTSFWGEHDFWS